MLFIKNGPNEATLMGAQSTYSGSPAADWTAATRSLLSRDWNALLGTAFPGSGRVEWHGYLRRFRGLEAVASGKTTSPRAGRNVYR